MKMQITWVDDQKEKMMEEKISSLKNSLKYYEMLKYMKKEQMKENINNQEMINDEYKEALQQLKATMEILKNVVDFGEKFEGLAQKKPKEELSDYQKMKEELLKQALKSGEIKAEEEKVSEWQEFFSHRMVDDRSYFVRWGDENGKWSSPLVAYWNEDMKSFFLCDGPAVPIAIDEFMEIPE